MKKHKLSLLITGLMALSSTVLASSVTIYTEQENPIISCTPSFGVLDASTQLLMRSFSGIDNDGSDRIGYYSASQIVELLPPAGKSPGRSAQCKLKGDACSIPGQTITDGNSTYTFGKYNIKKQEQPDEFSANFDVTAQGPDINNGNSVTCSYGATFVRSADGAV